jgi:hypothetical protein
MTVPADTFLLETPARQLGAVAATLARISSSAEKTARAKAIVPMLDECLQFIEWTSAHQTETASNELKDISVMLKLWRDGWESAQTNERLRTLLSVQAKKWSDQTLEFSGLLVS